MNKQALENLLRYVRMGIRVQPSTEISDLAIVERTWQERLFSLPWRPFVTHKAVYSPKGLLLSDGTLVVSLQTMIALEKALLDEPPRVR